MVTYYLGSMFETWWMEPLIATIGFYQAIVIYSWLEIKEGVSSHKSIQNLLFGFSREAASDLNDVRPSQIYSLVLYWLGILIFKSMVPPPAPSLPDGIPNSLSSLCVLCAEVMSGIVLYDIFFFFIHWTMHECTFFQWVHHKEHHKVKSNIEARHVLRHSMLDGTLQVLVNISVQRHTPWQTVKSRLARAIHNIVITWMLTESHTCTSYLYLFRRCCDGVKSHRKHHSGHGLDLVEGMPQYGKYHRYQQLFGFCDDFRAYLLRLKRKWTIRSTCYKVKCG